MWRRARAERERESGRACAFALPLLLHHRTHAISRHLPKSPHISPNLAQSPSSLIITLLTLSLPITLACDRCHASASHPPHCMHAISIYLHKSPPISSNLVRPFSPLSTSHCAGSPRRRIARRFHSSPPPHCMHAISRHLPKSPHISPNLAHSPSSLIITPLTPSLPINLA